MASPSILCATCLRAARRAASKGAIRSTPQSAKAYSRAATSRPQYPDFLAPAALKADLASLSGYRPSIFAQTQRLSRRSLATTADPSSAKPAHAVVNPRKDDSGNPMSISISPRASNRLHKISVTDGNPNLALRVTIESGGCHGFQYLMDLTDLEKSPATEEDTIFEGEKGEKVVIDESSLELLNGSTVDYTMELIGSQFKITGIPGATSSCGCGTSFDIKL
jgi:iron-sulfur cluster assembly accessory protein